MDLMKLLIRRKIVASKQNHIHVYKDLGPGACVGHVVYKCDCGKTMTVPFGKKVKKTEEALKRKNQFIEWEPF